MDADAARGLAESVWNGYLINCGTWTGKRAICNSSGKVLADLPTRVCAERFRTSDGDEFVAWRTSVKTVGKVDELEEEWSRSELANFGALVADGSFSVGADAFIGEPMTIDQCLCDHSFRIRTTMAFDWDGRLCGLIASREKLEGETASANVDRNIVEPAAWRSPRVLFDYMLGLWHGRGVCVDARSGSSCNLTSRLSLRQTADGRVELKSLLDIAGGGPVKVFDASAKLDGTLLMFTEGNVQFYLLPGGVFVSVPIAIRPGIPFAIQSAFLMRPDCRKRVLRFFNRQQEWVNTVFINERRVG